MYDEYGLTSKRLQSLYAKIEAIDVLLGSVRNHITQTRGDRKLFYKELSENLNEMRKAALTERCEVEARAAQGHVPAVGTLSNQSPITSPAGFPNANSGYFRGNPQLGGPDTSNG